MALKGDRYELQVDISFFNNGVANTRGGVACLTTVGSGGAMDQSVAVVGYPANSSGAFPMGIQLNDIVNIDLTRQHINFYRDEAIVGSKVAVARKGYLVTNSIIAGAAAIAAGDMAVLCSSGQLTNLPGTAEWGGSAWNKALNPKVGRWISTTDEDGYAKIEIQLT